MSPESKVMSVLFLSSLFLPLQGPVITLNQWTSKVRIYYNIYMQITINIFLSCLLHKQSFQKKPATDICVEPFWSMHCVTTFEVARNIYSPLRFISRVFGLR